MIRKAEHLVTEHEEHCQVILCSLNKTFIKQLLCVRTDVLSQRYSGKQDMIPFLMGPISQGSKTLRIS